MAEKRMTRLNPLIKPPNPLDLEDNIFNKGFEGAKEAVNYLYSLHQMLEGSSSQAVSMTTKWDGAPAIVAGKDPETGKFFVGTKGVFAKKAKINFDVKLAKQKHDQKVAYAKVKAAAAAQKLALKNALRYFKPELHEVLAPELLQELNTFGRIIAEQHMGYCLQAGIHIAGINSEIAPGQWEFQIGPVGAPNIGDEIWIARWLLYRIAEDYNISATLTPVSYTHLTLPTNREV